MRLRLFSRKKFFFHAPDKDSRQRLLFIKWMNAQDFFIKIISIVNSYTWHEFIGWLEGTIRRPIPKRNFNDHVVFFISLPFFLSFFLFFFLLPRIQPWTHLMHSPRHQARLSSIYTLQNPECSAFSSRHSLRPMVYKMNASAGFLLCRTVTRA